MLYSRGDIGVRVIDIVGIVSSNFKLCGTRRRCWFVVCVDEKPIGLWFDFV